MNCLIYSTGNSNKQIKRHSAASIIREMQVKTMRYHFPFIRKLY